MLPAFGGAPAAWAMVLVSFQTALLLGYGYAHLSVSRLGPRRGSIVHLAVLVAAIAVFALAPARFAEARITSLPPALDLLRLLAVTIGLPAVALAATTPLLSAWLAAVRVERGADGGPERRPERPVPPLRRLERGLAGRRPGLPLHRGAAGRAGRPAGRLALGLVRAARPVRGRRGRRAARGAASDRTGTATPVPPARRGAREPAAAPLDPRLVGRWLLLAAVPTGLLAAITNFVSTDLISAPLLWIGPLGIYLATLIVAFGGRGPAIAHRLAWLMPIVVSLLAVPFAAPIDWPVAPAARHRVRSGSRSSGWCSTASSPPTDPRPSG